MMNLSPLNAKERKKLVAQLDSQFGCGTDALKEFALLHNEKSGRLYVANPELLELDLEKIRIDAMGLYIGTLLANGEVRLSIEGSQLLGPKSTTNILEFSKAEFLRWIRGEVIEKDTDLKGFVIIKSNGDYCGCGKPVRDEKTDVISIHNYIPKTRYVHGD
jgi:NOL1/NOP2/fmu family ribosome biogenesis protein